MTKVKNTTAKTQTTEPAYVARPNRGDAVAPLDTPASPDITPAAKEMSHDPATSTKPTVPPSRVLDVADFDLDALAELFTTGAGDALTVALFGESTEPACSPRLVASDGDDDRCRLTGQPIPLRAGVPGVALAYDGADGSLMCELEVHPALASAGRGAVLAGLQKRLGRHMEELLAALVEVRWDLDLARAVRDGELANDLHGKA